MITFVLASHNRHKAQEIAEIVSHLDIVVETLEDHNIHEEIIEDGTTMTENAWIKADYVFNKLGGNVIADDSGIEVDALGGAPGLFSARYAGPQKSSDDNIDKLLDEMKGIDHRGAQFRAVMAVRMGEEKKTFEGIVRGTISEERIGKDGFGYDPVFIPDGYDTSFGVLSSEIKNSISHRAEALRQFEEYLQSKRTKG